MVGGQQFEMLIIIQARMGSTRFPGKILEKLSGIPSIIYQINRIKPLLELNHKLVVATTNEQSDDVLCQLLQKHDVEFLEVARIMFFKDL